MSIPVSIDALRAAIEERGARAYLLTTSDDGRPHAVHVALGWDGEALATEVGKRSAANAAARTWVSLLYPLRSEGDYSLIVDGTATVDGLRLRITPVKAVLHRPAAAPDPSSACGADCAPLVPASRTGS